MNSWCDINSPAMEGRATEEKFKKLTGHFTDLITKQSFQMNILQISCIHCCTHRGQLEGAWVGLKI